MYYTIVRDIRAKIPLNLSLKISITLTLRMSATVTAVPFGRVNGLVIPFKVSVMGNVVVASDGIGFSILTVK